MTKKIKDFSEIPSNVANRHDKSRIDYAQFEFSNNKKEIRIEGNQFDVDVLLNSFGVELDNTGTMALKASDNDYIHLDEGTNQIERIVDGKPYAKSTVSEEKANRLKEQELARREEER